MPPIPMPDIVLVSKLDTQFCSSPAYTQHVQYVPGSTLERRRVRKEERWGEKKGLGSGAFGVVWLEECIRGDGKGKVRAVKKIQKLGGNSYYRELEAIALFSHSKYEQCFVKSFGWYDDEDSIFIAMEYLPNGDLHKYLDSPLQESEGRHIVSQVLEGLCFMHQNGFAHRDLKPANILVVCKHPNWWVKIADFGISKRATEGLTALRTLTGTPSFAAPEALGYTDSEYTNAVDIWSLSVITFLILTGETLFKDLRRLGQYVTGSFEFPSDVLLANKVSEQACEFIRSLMAPKSEDRPGAEESLQHPWLDCLTEAAASEHRRDSTVTDVQKPPEIPSYYPDAEASANWSTQDQTLQYASASWSTQGQNPAFIPQSLVIRQSAPKPITSTGRLSSSEDRATIDREANKLLLDNGFDIKALFNEQAALEGDFGIRALHWAAENGHEAAVRLLLEKGADVAAKSTNGWTALHVAAENGHELVAWLLLKNGADVEAKSAKGWTALHVAAENGHEAVVQVLLETGVEVADVAAKTDKGWTALHVAAENRHEAVMLELLEKGADVTAKTAKGWTALHVAANNGHEAVVRVVLEKGADVAAKSADGRTALYVAAQNGDEAVVRVLVEKGADVTAKLADGRTALHVAARNGHEAVVRMLVEKGADVTAKSDSGWTVLQLAARNGHEAVVRVLEDSVPKDGKRPWYKII